MARSAIETELLGVVDEAFPMTGERFALVVVRPGDPDYDAGPIVARNDARWLVARALTYDQTQQLASITQQECFFVRDAALPMPRERLRSYLAAVAARIAKARFEDLTEQPPWTWFAGELLEDPELVTADDFLLAFPRVILAFAPPPLHARGVTLTRAAAKRLERTYRHRLEAESHRTVQPLEVGDILETFDAGRAVVTAIVDSLSGAEIAWPGISRRHNVGKVVSARETLHARSIGPCSLVTQQPLPNGDIRGQLVTRAQVEALLDRGAPWVVHELLTAKSDDVDGRVQTYGSIVTGDPKCMATIPRMTRNFERTLLALGFDVSIDEAAVSIALLSDETIRAKTSGRVTLSDTIDEETHAPLRGGLFCTEIFGAVGSPERVTTMGHLALPIPVMHPWTFELACATLGIDREELGQVLDGERTITGGEPASWTETGPIAVRDALAARGVTGLFLTLWPVLPPDLRPIIPLSNGKWATSDLNDLYLNVIDCAARVRRSLEAAALGPTLRFECGSLQRAIAALVENGCHGAPVEADGRKFVSLADTLGTGGVSDRLNLLSKRVDYSAIAHVVTCEKLATEKVLLPRTAALELFRPWIYAALEEAGHVTTLRAARDLVTAADPRATAALEKVAVDYPVILFFDGSSNDVRVVALRVGLWDTPAFGIARSIFDTVGRPTTATLHVPIDPRAIAEAHDRLQLGPRPVATRTEDDGWLARVLEAAHVGPVLVDAALRREVDAVRDWRARLMLGRPPE